ncbi:S8 family peptidase [Wukongibacter baidiensis]|uniref:S8 family peptidase n=1 Tax=Wukongibacter baidiensis TaxID=1723361 RepID=UPI003D7FAA1E
MKKINQKIDTTLDLALQLPEERKQRSGYLKTGFETLTDTWEVIVKYTGKNIKKIAEELDASLEILSDRFAILTIEEEKIYLLSQYKEIEYIEKPRRLINSINTVRRYSLDDLQRNYANDLRGEGVLIGIIDSGVDYSNLDFMNEDGTTRIISIWDQSVVEGEPPKGFNKGTEWSRKEINEALKNIDGDEDLSAIHHVDALGHGTCIAEIAAGNGKSSGENYSGVAPKTELIVVKLGARGGEGFSRTTEFMRAMRYIVDKAKKLKKPIVINGSYGTNEGAHDGNSLFESFIDEILDEWKVTMVVAAGNEGNAGHHFGGKIEKDEEKEIELEVGKEERVITLEIWKSFHDILYFELISPYGHSSGRMRTDEDLYKIDLDNLECYVCFNEPNQYDKSQQGYILILPKKDTIKDGIWKLRIYGENVVDGNLDIWLPMSEVVGEETRFLKPEINGTVKVPGTASKVITVGSYDPLTDSVCDFSGKGNLKLEDSIKPELVAPYKNIIKPIDKIDNGSLVGTGISAAYVTGAAALLMEWGIVKGNDPDLYGEKVKTYLTKGAMRKNRNIEFPNRVWGFGSLWIENSIAMAEGGGFRSYNETKVDNEHINERIVKVLGVHPRLMNPVFLSYLPKIYKKYKYRD